MLTLLSALFIHNLDFNMMMVTITTMFTSGDRLQVYDVHGVDNAGVGTVGQNSGKLLYKNWLFGFMSIGYWVTWIYPLSCGGYRVDI